jgi:hypothetical protein
MKSLRVDNVDTLKVGDTIFGERGFGELTVYVPATVTKITPTKRVNAKLPDKYYEGCTVQFVVKEDASWYVMVNNRNNYGTPKLWPCIAESEDERQEKIAKHDEYIATKEEDERQRRKQAEADRDEQLRLIAEERAAAIEANTGVEIYDIPYHSRLKVVTLVDRNGVNSDVVFHDAPTVDKWKEPERARTMFYSTIFTYKTDYCDLATFPVFIEETDALVATNMFVHEAIYRIW